MSIIDLKFVGCFGSFVTFRSPKSFSFHLEFYTFHFIPVSDPGNSLIVLGHFGQLAL